MTQVLETPRLRLVSALATAAAEKGYAATTIADIVRHAHVSKRTFYEHFPDKQSCYLEAYRRGTEHLARLMLEAGTTATGPWRERLRAALQAYLGVLVDRPASTLSFTTGIAAAGPEAIAARRAMHRRTAEALTAVVDDVRRDAPELAPLRPIHAEAIVGALSELILNAVADDRIEDLPTLAAPIIDSFLVGVRLADKAEFERHLTVTSTPAQEGSWGWISDTEAHYRPKEYWQPGTKLHLDARLVAAYVDPRLVGATELEQRQHGDALPLRREGARAKFRRTRLGQRQRARGLLAQEAAGRVELSRLTQRVAGLTRRRGLATSPAWTADLADPCRSDHGALCDRYRLARLDDLDHLDDVGIFQLLDLGRRDHTRGPGFERIDRPWRGSSGDGVRRRHDRRRTGEMPAERRREATREHQRADGEAARNPAAHRTCPPGHIGSERRLEACEAGLDVVCGAAAGCAEVGPERRADRRVVEQPEGITSHCVTMCVFRFRPGAGRSRLSEPGGSRPVGPGDGRPEGPGDGRPEGPGDGRPEGPGDARPEGP